jgi:hypothetical protein
LITVVTGNPGAGKTANVVQYDLVRAMVRGPWGKPPWARTQVATNVTLRDDWAEAIAAGLPLRSKARRQQLVCDFHSRLYRFHDFGTLPDFGLACNVCGAEDEPCGHERKEGRGLCIFDESSDPLDTRTWDMGASNKKDSVLKRKSQIDFLKQHRKAGWHVILIAQDLKMLDSQIRSMVDYERMLRNLKHWKLPLIGFPIGAVFGNLFTAIEAWESGPRKKRGMMVERMINGRRMYRLRKSTKRVYDTHGKSHELALRTASIWLPRSVVLGIESSASAAKPAALAPGQPDLLEPAAARQLGSVEAGGL